MTKKAIIIGAGPAGLTAAYELLKRTDIKPIILEKSGDIGGISKTINYKGNRMDMGPHRFFSKSDRVMNWWLNIMPLDTQSNEAITINYQNKQREIHATENNSSGNGNGNVMLVIRRLTRIYFLRKFFAYPIQLSLDTLRTLGLIRTIKILFSFLWVRLFPIKPEKSLEDFIINKFGRQLYLLFFKDYTEKVWGVPCHEISAEWGAQRIKGVSLGKAIGEAIKSLRKKKGGDIGQKEKETSLIEQFLYPKHGPGSLWEEVARQVQEMGGKIYLNQNVTNIYFDGDKIAGINTTNSETNQTGAWEGDYFFSSMPVQELIAGMDAGAEDRVPEDVKQVAAGLQYRDFINVGILLKQLSKPAGHGTHEKLELKDNWIYIQERDVKVGRLMIYNNWGGGMINDPNNTWIGMEYFCSKSDSFWALPDKAIERIAIEELEKMELARVDDVLDITVRRMEKTYPAYFGTYNEFDKIKDYVNQFENLFLVGRNGMHKYNNADHSMLTAMVSVDNICEGIKTKENIWAINTEQEYHEVKKAVEEDQNAVPKKEEPELSSAAAFQSNESFKDFLFQNKQNRKLLWWSAILIFIQLLVFKYLYPFPSFINNDSYSYLESASKNLSINIYPVGYSMFLRLLSVFTKSDILVVSFQYLLLQASILGFVFTVFYWYKPEKSTQIILLFLLVVNPVLLYLANYIGSDAYFISLSLIWFTLLLWIIHRPDFKLILLHGLVLYIAFTVRYNAIFYPVVAAIAFFYKRKKLLLKFAGLGLTALLIGTFMINNGYNYKRLTGTFQFSPFTGWQLANNAMFIYRYVDRADRVPVPSKFKDLDNRIREYFDSTRDTKKFPEELIKANTFYMWSHGLPLHVYMNDQFKRDSTASKFRRWASMGPLYKEYGWFIIKSYPLNFLEYYIWPNMVRYYSPPLEFLSVYSTGEEIIKEPGKTWFDFRTNKLYNRVGTFEVSILDYLPIITGITNIVFIVGLLGYIFLGGPLTNIYLKKVLGIIILFWLSNFGFSVLVAPITLRYQLFPLTITSTFTILFLEFILKSAFQPTTMKQLDSYSSLQMDIR